MAFLGGNGCGIVLCCAMHMVELWFLRAKGECGNSGIVHVERARAELSRWSVARLAER